MNLLNKKFKEKRKLYKDNSNHNNEINNPKQIKNFNTSNNNNSDFLEKIKNPTNSYFDKIYSDFLLLPNYINKINDNNNVNNNTNNNKEQYSSNINDFNEKVLFENKKIIKALGDKKNNNKRKNKLNLNQSKNIYFYKMNIPNSNNNNIGERLYNNSFITKTKIENQRKMRDDDFKKNLIPKITLKAKKMKFEEERLYNDNIIKKMRKNLSQKNIYEKDKTCSFKPLLNKKSLKMAEKLEPFTYRINKKKCKISKDEIFDLKRKNYTNLFTKINENNTFRKKQNKSMENINKKIEQFYKKQFDKIKLREKKYNENKIKKESEYKKYPYQPKINKKPLSLNKTYIKIHNNSTKNIFERLYKSNKACKKKINYIKTNEIKENEICTFKPEISPLNIKDDEKIISNNLTQNNFYILKRRKNLEKKKNLEKYKNKKMGNIYGFFKPVIVNKDNGLRTERRCSSKGDKSFNKDESNRYIITKGTVDFNNGNRTRRNEKIFYYLNDENENMNINIIKYNNIRNDINQKEFLEAINALHNQIDNLDI